jgi:hypothetical protein
MYVLCLVAFNLIHVLFCLAIDVYLPVGSSELLAAVNRNQLAIFLVVCLFVIRFIEGKCDDGRRQQVHVYALRVRYDSAGCFARLYDSILSRGRRLAPTRHFIKIVITHPRDNQCILFVHLHALRVRMMALGVLLAYTTVFCLVAVALHRRDISLKLLSLIHGTLSLFLMAILFTGQDLVHGLL